MDKLCRRVIVLNACISSFEDETFNLLLNFQQLSNRDPYVNPELLVITNEYQTAYVYFFPSCLVNFL